MRQLIYGYNFTQVLRFGYQLVAFFLITFMLFGGSCIAQNDSILTTEQITVYSNQSKQLISYLEGTLNFLGDPDELQSDKDIIFNSSYLKFFKNDQVQIEDDLDENREIPLNKDVQAYLKDVDFFYKSVKFHFKVENIEQLVTSDGIIVFKLTLNRHLEGITINNDTVVNNQLRFIEINLDPFQRDLKIVSIYTTLINEKEELKYWWNNMSVEWKNFFGKSVIVYDSIRFKNIIWFSDSSVIVQKWFEKISIDTIYTKSNIPNISQSDSMVFLYDTTTTLIDPDTIRVNTSIVYSVLKTFKGKNKLDISNNLIFKDINPISELTDLREINISNTLIDELLPIRNLNKLEVFNCSGSRVNSLEALVYITTIKEFNCSNTSIEDIDILSNLGSITDLDLSNTNIIVLEALSNLSKLVHLNLSETNVVDLSPLNGLSLLSDLNISSTQLHNLSSIDSLTNIQNLNIDSTNIANLEPLSNYYKLSILQANNTDISDISPLNNHELLKVIYCDNSNVSMDMANTFMDTNPQCLVIYNSQELIKWCDDLSSEWKTVFSDNYNIATPAKKEELQQLINENSLSIAYNKSINSLEPLRMLHRLEVIDIQHTSITDLSPLSGLTNLENIILNQTNVTSLDPLSSLINLKTISFTNTEVDDLSPLLESNNIEVIYCDESNITTEDVLEFKKAHPSCLIIYQSETLRLWWNNLDAEWQKMLGSQMDLPSDPSNEELQQLVDLTELSILNNLSLFDLNPLHIFVRLEKLTIKSTSISDISPITSLTGITQLNVSNNPISDIELIYRLTNLYELNLSNTTIEDLEPISGLRKLTSLNIAGTKIKSLKYIEKLINLEKIYLNNTRIKNIKQLADLSNIKLVQCYNTSIKASKVKDYSDANPSVEVIYY